MKKLFILLFFITAFASTAYAVDYHADETGGAVNLAACSGADPGNGSRCDTEDVEDVTAGSTVYWYDDGGPITGQVNVSVSGTDDNVITHVKAAGETPVFTRDWQSFDIIGKNYIKLDGLTFTGGNHVQVQISTGSTYIEVDDCTFGDDTDYGKLFIESSSYCYIHDNNFNAAAGTRIESSESDSIRLSYSHHNRIIDNTFTDGSGHSQIVIRYSTSQYNVVRGNTHIVTDAFSDQYSTTDTAISILTDASYNLLEQNIMYETGTNPSDRTEGLKSGGGSYNIWRRNTVYNWDRAGWACYNENEYNTVYNNTFYNVASAPNYGGAIDLNAADGVYTRYNKFINNIIDKSNKNGYRLDSANEARITDNIFRNGIVYNITDNPVHRYNEALTVTTAESSYPAEFSGNIITQPTYTNAAGGVFTPLNGSSVQVDAGTYLTLANGAAPGASSATLTVDSGGSYFFWDGNSITGETADYIYIVSPIAGNVLVQIASVDSATQITLASEQDWDDDAEVYLAVSSTVGFYGAGPDIGADEYNGTPVPVIATTNPSNIDTATDSGQLSVTGTATDDLAVTDCKWRVGAAVDAGNGTGCTADVGTFDTASEAFTCATTFTVEGANTLYVGCTDAEANWGNYSIVVNFDETVPTVTAKVIEASGTVFRVTFSEKVHKGASWANNEYNLDVTGGTGSPSADVSLTYTEIYGGGTGTNIWYFTIGETIAQNATVNFDLSATANVIEDHAKTTVGNDLAQITNGATDNQSAQGDPPTTSTVVGVSIN